jgi:AcrR family transcriptional regulator
MSGFTDEERERITDGLVTAGQTLFGQYGLERTRIADLTDEVGIGTSTFYQFFDSKETLYLEILRRERIRISEEIDDILADSEPLESEIRAALAYLFEEVATNPIYEQLLAEDELRSLHSRLPEEAMEEHYRAEFAEYEPHARRWTEIDEFRLDDPTVVVGLFRMVGLAALSEERFARDAPPGADDVVRDVFIDCLVDGLLIDE